MSVLTAQAQPAGKPKATAKDKDKDKNVTFLDDLKETSFTTLNQQLGKHGETLFPGEDIKRCRIGRTELKHALSMHPTQEKDAVVAYPLEKKYRLFRAVAALNTPVAGDGLALSKSLKWSGKALAPVTFRVVGDGKVLWESKPLQKSGDTQECEVVVKDVDQLELQVHCAGLANFAWAFWGNPRVVSKEPMPSGTTAKTNPSGEKPAAPAEKK